MRELFKCNVLGEIVKLDKQINGQSEFSKADDNAELFHDDCENRRLREVVLGDNMSGRMAETKFSMCISRLKAALRKFASVCTNANGHVEIT